jgi:hypothetical protein
MCNRSLSPPVLGSAAILAASLADGTPALPEKSERLLICCIGLHNHRQVINHNNYIYQIHIKHGTVLHAIVKNSDINFAIKLIGLTFQILPI